MIKARDEQRIFKEIQLLSRHQVVQEILGFQGGVRMDFTEEFLDRQTLDQLKHILLAVRLHISPA